MENTTPTAPSFWELKEENMIVKRISDTEVYLVQVKGRELHKDFSHNHGRVTYPSKERLDERLERFAPSSEEEYETLLAAYFQINDPKREVFNRRRQEKYELNRAQA